MNEGVLIRTGEGREERERGGWVGKFFKKKKKRGFPLIRDLRLIVYI